MKNDGSQLAETAEMTEKPWTVWGSKWDLWGEKSVNLIMIPTWYQLTPCWRLVIVSNWKVPLPLKSRPSLGGDFPFEPFQHEDVELCAKVGLSVSVFFPRSAQIVFVYISCWVFPSVSGPVHCLSELAGGFLQRPRHRDAAGLPKACYRTVNPRLINQKQTPFPLV